MSGISAQARRVIDAVREIGIPRNEFSVRTETHIIRDNGTRYREYGDAVLITYGRTASQTVVENAQRLADAGLVVTIIHGENGRMTPVVSSGWNPRKVVDHIHVNPQATDSGDAA